MPVLLRSCQWVNCPIHVGKKHNTVRGNVYHEVYMGVKRLEAFECKASRRPFIFSIYQYDNRSSVVSNSSQKLRSHYTSENKLDIIFKLNSVTLFMHVGRASHQIVSPPFRIAAIAYIQLYPTNLTMLSSLSGFSFLSWPFIIHVSFQSRRLV